MKTICCKKCDTEKPERSFNWLNKSKGKRQAWCRECKNAANRSSYKKHKDNHVKTVRDRMDRVVKDNREKIIQHLLDNPCPCGESDPLVLQFDHLKDKSLEVSEMLRRGYSWGTIEKEISKCQVLCGNCHLRKTAHEVGNWKLSHLPL